jgi:hypothetical protein
MYLLNTFNFSENEFIQKEIDEKRECFFRIFFKLKRNKIRNDSVNI